MCPFGGRFIDGRDGTLVCHVLLIETEHHGLVLVDTGIGLEDVADPNARLGGPFRAVARPTLRAEETARRQVEALGFDPADVRNVVLTHMDLDHAGGLSDFPHAAVHLFVDEHHAAIDPPTAEERYRYRSIQWAHGPRFETYDADGEPWHGFACARDLRGLPPEILIVPMVGHSRGHAAVAVDTGDGWLLHAGDAYFHAEQMRFERPACPAGLALFQSLVAWDRPKMRWNQGRLRELVRDHGDAVTVFSAHDPTELSRLRGAAPGGDR